VIEMMDTINIEVMITVAEMTAEATMAVASMVITKVTGIVK